MDEISLTSEEVTMRLKNGLDNESANMLGEEQQRPEWNKPFWPF